MIYRCAFPPCKAVSHETKDALKQLGWKFKRDGTVICPAHTDVQPLFPVSAVKTGDRPTAA